MTILIFIALLQLCGYTIRSAGRPLHHLHGPHPRQLPLRCRYKFMSRNILMLGAVPHQTIRGSSTKVNQTSSLIFPLLMLKRLLMLHWCNPSRPARAPGAGPGPQGCHPAGGLSETGGRSRAHKRRAYAQQQGFASHCLKGPLSRGA